MKARHQFFPVFLCVLLSGAFASAVFKLFGLLPDFQPEWSGEGITTILLFIGIIVVTIILLALPFLIISFFLRILLERLTDYRGLSLIELFVDIIWGSLLGGLFILVPIVILANVLGVPELPGAIEDIGTVTIISASISWQITRHVAVPSEPESES